MSARSPHPSRDILEQAIKAVQNAPTPAETPAHWITSTVDAIHVATSPHISPGEEVRLLRRKRIMRYIKYGTLMGVAASIVVALGLLLATPGNTLASDLIKALEKVNDAKSYQHVIKMTMDGKTMSEMRTYKQGEVMRFEVPGVLTLISDGKSVLQLDMTKKTASRPTIDELKERTAQDLKANDKEIGKSKALIEKIKTLKGDGIELLGEETIENVKTKVYAIRDVVIDQSKSNWKVWIDPKQNTPVRMQTTNAEEGAQFVITSVYSKWNEKFDEKLFSMEVPEGYTLVETNKK
jgi:outer membrane lipoprotein-sorting protein